VRLGCSRLIGCHRCGSWTYLPRHSEGEQVAIHDSPEYFDHPYFESRRKTNPHLEKRCRGVFTQLGSAIDLITLRGQRLLDIGCDTGAFLDCAARHLGIVPVGVDVAARAVAGAASLGIEGYQTSIERAPTHLRDFPVITAIDLIEHVNDPSILLQEIRSRLRPGGVAYLETPNIRSAVYCIGRVLCRMTRGWPPSLFNRLFPPQHIQYFTADGLAALASSSGFEVVQIKSRVLSWSDIAASWPVRASMAALQACDRLTGNRILLCATLRRPINDKRLPRSTRQS